MTSPTHAKAPLREGFVPREVEEYLATLPESESYKRPTIRAICRSVTAYQAGPRAAAAMAARTGHVWPDPDYIPGYDDGCEPPEGRNEN